MNTYPCDYDSPFDEVTLARKEYAAQVAIDRHQLDLCRQRGKVETLHDHATNQLHLLMRAFIYGKDHPSKHVVRYPADWWQAVKERFAPVWFRDRYPVQFITVTASLEELYPEIEPALPDQSPVMKFIVKKKIEFPIW